MDPNEDLRPLIARETEACRTTGHAFLWVTTKWHAPANALCKHYPCAARITVNPDGTLLREYVDHSCPASKEV